MNAIKMLRTLNMDISCDILCTLTFGLVKLYCFLNIIQIIYGGYYGVLIFLYLPRID